MTDMQISDAGINLIANFEQFSPLPVPDGSKMQVGFGHDILPDENFLEGVTRDVALALLHKDATHAATCVNDYVTVDLTQNQFDALCSLCYNIGGHAFQNSTLVKMLNNGQFNEAAEQFLRWKYDAGNVVAGLAARREDERALFLKPMSA